MAVAGVTFEECCHRNFLEKANFTRLEHAWKIVALLK
jgi:hypothetical protein